MQFHLHTLKEKIKTVETCSKYASSSKFNVIPIEGQTSILIKSYKDKWHEHMIRNIIWDVFPLPDLCNKENKWYLFIHQYIFPLGYVKRHVNSHQKGSEAFQYVAQNLTCSGVYLRSTLSNILLKKVLTLVLLTTTGPEFSFTTTTTLSLILMMLWRRLLPTWRVSSSKFIQGVK